MGSKYTILRALEKYGDLSQIDGKPQRVIFRALRKNQDGGEEYWCAAAPGAGLRAGSRMNYDGKSLVVIRADCQKISGAPLYEWAILRQEQGGALCG